MRTVTIEIEITRKAAAALATLLSTGFYGHSLSDAATEMVYAGIRAAGRPDWEVSEETLCAMLGEPAPPETEDD